MNLPKKKKQLEVVGNGSYPVTIKTRHGQFLFPLQKYLINQENSNYFALTFQFTINSLITNEMKISPTVDIYDSKTEEILLFDDGISVKKQKDNRERHQNIISSEPSTWEGTETSDQKKSRKKVITDIVLLETPLGSFEYITTPIDADGKPLFSLAQTIKAKLKTHYHDYNCPLPIVAITDGASNIRKRLNKLSDNFGTVKLTKF